MATNKEEGILEVDITDMSENTFEDPYTSRNEKSDSCFQQMLQSAPISLTAWLNRGTEQQQRLKLIAAIATLLLTLLVIFAVIAGITTIVNFTDNDASDGDNVSHGGSYNSSRLPSWATPVSYNLTLTPDLTNFTFSGLLSLQFTVTSAKNYIILNALDLDIQSATFHVDDTAKEDLSITQYEKTEMIGLNFKKPLALNKVHRVDFVYTGNIQNDMRGFYRSVYQGEDGKQHWLASTQFESTDARLAFPCFDEPQFKAKFTIALQHPSYLISLSNMPEQHKTVNNGITSVTFEETPPMSTYLVAFLVGEFSNVNGTFNDKDVRIWAPTGQEQHGVAALNAAIAVLTFFEDYFGIPFTLPKIDLIAIPDFSAGAMENWGLLTFRLTALLFNEAEDTAANLQRVATVVAHELAHQWTGDLVTTAWWSHLWLNEGFADYFESKSVGNVFPAWNMNDQFIVDDQHVAFATDSLRSTHPIIHQVETPAEIQEMFDDITYEKGASVLRMLESFVTPELFRQGMNEYLTQFSFNNTFTSDFFSVMSKVSGKNVTERYLGWTELAGYPVLTVTLSSDKKQATITQQRFYSSNEPNTTLEPSSWFIDLNYVTNRNVNVPVADSFQSATKTLQFSNTISYIKLNWGQTGYYRVNYPEDMWKVLNEHFMTFASADRAGMINDALVLARAGLLPTSIALDLISVLTNETEYSVWMSALAELNYIGRMLTSESFYDQYLVFIQDLLTTVYEYVEWQTTESVLNLDHNKALLRSQILSFSVKYRMPSALAAAYEIWNNFKTNAAPIAPDDREAVYCAALYIGSSADYWYLIDMLEATSNSAEVKRILTTLGCTREYYLLQYGLTISMNSSVVKQQDQYILINSVAANPLGADLAWNFFQENWDTFNNPGFGLPKLVASVTKNFHDQFHLREVTTFFENHPSEIAQTAIDQAIETVRENVMWVSANADGLQQFLKSRLS